MALALPAMAELWPRLHVTLKSPPRARAGSHEREFRKNGSKKIPYLHTYQMTENSTQQATESSTLQSQLALWPTQETQRMELNDHFDTPRPVEHFAYFRRRAYANVAGAELQAHGFSVEIARRGLLTFLQATRVEPLDYPSVERFLSEVIAVVEKSRGDYDGWGAAVESPA